MGARNLYPKNWISRHHRNFLYLLNDYWAISVRDFRHDESPFIHSTKRFFGCVRVVGEIATLFIQDPLTPRPLPPKSDLWEAACHLWVVG